MLAATAAGMFQAAMPRGLSQSNMLSSMFSGTEDRCAALTSGGGSEEKVELSIHHWPLVSCQNFLLSLLLFLFS
jgi:hypothetical protein